MTIEEKIQKKAEGYGELAPVFLEGAKFALENQWISVEDDLPCNHKELLYGVSQTVKVITAYEEERGFSSDFMIKDSFNDNWDWNCWNGYYAPDYWMFPPELPKE